MERFFVTSTGTGIGKTLITAALTHQMRQAGRKVRAIKPVASGIICEDPVQLAESDPAILARSLGAGEGWLEAISPFHFRAPLSPDQAARRENRQVELADIIAFCKQVEAAAPDIILVEGVGGVMVPLNHTSTVLDVMQALDYQIIIVAGTYLGAMSHTLTAVRVLEQAGLKLHALVLNESEESPVSPDEMQASLKPFISTPMHIVPRLPPQADVWRAMPPLAHLLHKGRP